MHFFVFILMPCVSILYEHYFQMFHINSPRDSGNDSDDQAPLILNLSGNEDESNYGSWTSSLEAYPELAARPRQASSSPDMPAVGDSPDRANPVPNPSSETEDGEENPDQGS